eukprot:Opistho-1_new@58402
MRCHSGQLHRTPSHRAVSQARVRGDFSEGLLKREARKRMRGGSCLRRRIVAQADEAGLKLRSSFGGSGPQRHATGRALAVAGAAQRQHMPGMQGGDLLLQGRRILDLLGMALEHQTGHVDQLGIARAGTLLDQQLHRHAGRAAHRMAHGRLGDAEDARMAVAQLGCGADIALGHSHQHLGAGLGAAVAQAQAGQHRHHLLELDLLARQAHPQRHQQAGGLEIELRLLGLTAKLACQLQRIADLAVQQAAQAAEQQLEALQALHAGLPLQFLPQRVVRVVEALAVLGVEAHQAQPHVLCVD